MEYIKQIFKADDLADGILKAQSILMNGSDTDIVLAGGSSPVLSFEGEKTFASFAAATELDNYAVIGALLWKATDGSILVNNGDSTAAGYWDPKSSTISTPSKEGYTLFAVNVGYGLWARVKHELLLKESAWANDYIMHGDMIHSKGRAATAHILGDGTEAELKGTIWEAIHRESNYKEFIPSKYELLEIQENCCDGHPEQASSGCTYEKNLGKLLGLDQDDYWSSSQGSYSSLNAFLVNFSGGYIDLNSKDNECRAVPCLQFGA